MTNPAGRLAHPGRVDHLGCHPGDLTDLHGDRGPIGEPAGRLLVRPDRREHVHLPGHLHDLVHRCPGRRRREHRHHRPAGRHRPRLVQQWGTSSLDVGATQVGYCEATDTSTSTPTVTCYVQRGHGRCLDHRDGHTRRRDQPRCRLRHSVGFDHLGPDAGDFGELRPRGPGGGHLLVHRPRIHHDQLPDGGLGLHRPAVQHRRRRDLPDHAGIPPHHSGVGHQPLPGPRGHLAHRQLADDQRKRPDLGGSRRAGR